MLIEEPHLNASARKAEHKEEKQEEIERLKRSAEDGVEKVKKLAESLRSAVKDDATIELAANRPFEGVKAEVAKSDKEVSSTIQLNALRQAYNQARDASSHVARGTQSQVRKEARKVESACDRLARISPADEGLARKWSDQVEADADDTENLGETLARKTQ